MDGTYDTNNASTEEIFTNKNAKIILVTVMIMGKSFAYSIGAICTCEYVHAYLPVHSQVPVASAMHMIMHVQGCRDKLRILREDSVHVRHRVK